jgi:hypothetical protein
MLTNLKALIVVLAMAAIIFAMARPFCLRFTAVEDFNRRRIVWFLLTSVAFISPSFWLYVLVAIPVMVWSGKRDTSPLALYFLLIFIIPPFVVDIPIVGINRLFEINQSRLLGFFVLLPTVWQRGRESTSINNKNWFLLADVLLLLYGALQLILFVPYESPTNTLRRAFLYLVDTYLVYYTFSRLTNNRRALLESLGALCLSACLYAPMALFESLKGWLLYTEIADRWGIIAEGWLLRGDSLRAQVSLGHSLTLGFSLAIGVGAWMHLKSTEPSRVRRAFVFGLLSVGLFFTYSRAPWLVAALIPILYLGLASKNLVSFVKSMLLLVVIAGGIALTPLGSAIISLLPGVGTQGQETVDYRQQLAATSWRLIQLHPLLGNPFVLLDMEDLRQGQGIIDLVNAFAAVALFYGLVGLVLYCGVFVTALVGGFNCLLRSRMEGDMEMVSLGATLLACLLMTLLFMGTGGFIWMQWQLAGLLIGYAGLRTARTIPEPVLREGLAMRM